MKILCVIDSLGSGGAQRQLVNLAIGFKNRGFEVSFLVYHRNDFYKKHLIAHGIAIHEIIEVNYLKRLLKMRKFIRTGGFYAVLSFLEAANFICEISGFPYRDWRLVVGERSANPNILKIFKLRIYRWFHLFADHVVANSNENINMVRQINPMLLSRKCHVINNIVDFSIWHPSNNYSPRKNGKLNLIVVASHLYIKNLDGLIESVKLLSPSDKNRLHIGWYGKDSLDDSLIDAKNKIERYGLKKIFTFYKPTLQIHEMVQDADVAGLFSFYEGLPNVVCETMAAGKPVIASRISDIPSLIDNCQMTFDPNDPEEISRILSNLINLNDEELMRLGKRNYIVASSLFNEESILNKYITLFKFNKNEPY